MQRFAPDKIESPIAKQTQVYERLKQAIMYAKFEPGEILSLRTLAASFGTSTMPVRDATTRLITERALEALPNRGLRVPALGKMEAQDILRVRVVLEAMAAGLAAESITGAELRELERCELKLEHAVRKKQLAEALQHNLTFHLGICRASRSDTIVSTIESLYVRYAPRMYMVMRHLPDLAAGQIHHVHMHHEAVLDALRRANPTDARAAIEADLADAMRLDSLFELPTQDAAPELPGRSRRPLHAPARRARAKPSQRTRPRVGAVRGG
jgi:DNA-binding GntR family transcriptional regulator